MKKVFKGLLKFLNINSCYWVYFVTKFRIFMWIYLKWVGVTHLSSLLFTDYCSLEIIHLPHYVLIFSVSKSNNESSRCVGIDLSSGTKNSGGDSSSLMDEVQDFSMPNKNRHSQFSHPSQHTSSANSYHHQTSPALQGSSSKNKIDDLALKGMQKKGLVSTTSWLFHFS